MTRTDSFVVGTLVVLLAIVAGLIGIPALQPSTASSSGSPDPGSSELPATARPYVEGAIGTAVSVTPLTATTQIDRDLVALVFAGLVRNGPNGTIVPDLAERWSVDADGKRWTVQLREDVRWHDGEPVTADDVAFTIRTLQDPAYTGPAGASWDGVSVAAIDDRTVSFSLDTPLAGFLQALTQPIAPAHLLGDVPVESLPDHPIGRQPIGSGPFSLLELSDTGATLVPAEIAAADATEPPEATPGATDSLTTPPPTVRPDRPLPYLAGIDFRFYDDPEELAADYRSGEVDGVSGVSPVLAAELGAGDQGRLLRYPGATLATVLLNLRSTHPEFASPEVRTALLAAIDRAAIIDTAYGTAAAPATGLIPPSSPMFDEEAAPAVDHDTKAARAALKKADWTEKDDAWYLPKAKDPLKIEVLSPTEEANPGLFAAAERVVADWKAIGLGATHVALPPSEFVMERLAKGEFAAAVVDVNVGLDPDLYPLLASTQTLTGRSNVIGVQDPDLDKLLAEARAPGTDEERKAAYKALQEALAKGRYLLPLAFPDEIAVAADTLEGPVVRQVSDPSDRFWDVLTWRLADGR
jgi:peptide/nickel transport system substrate-binding protein